MIPRFPELKVLRAAHPDHPKAPSTRPVVAGGVTIGGDVPVVTFVEKVKEIKPDLLLLSALLTTTMPNQQKTIEALKAAGLRDGVKVMIGGAPTTRAWADEIGADGYAEDAIEAVAAAKILLGVA